MKYLLIIIILFLVGSYYLVDSGRADYIARANVYEVFTEFRQYQSCLSKKKETLTNDNCILKESEFYKVDYSDIENVLVDFNFKTQKHETSISKKVEGVIKLSVNNKNNSRTIGCVNISLKRKFLPPSLCQEI